MQQTVLKVFPIGLQQNENGTRPQTVQQYNTRQILSYIKRFADFTDVFGCKAVIVPVKPTVPEILGSTKYTTAHNLRSRC